MRTVYDATHGVDAQIVADVLKGEGIEAFVTGAGLVGAAGELPAIGLVKVRVADDDAERALAVVRAWEASTPPMDEDQPASPADPRPRRSAPSFVVGLAIGAGVAWTIAHGWPNSVDNKGHEAGFVDRRWIKAGDRVVRIETDRNADGRVDEVMRMGERDGDSVVEQDQDFDGVFEYEMRVADYLPTSISGDRDGDGYDEYHASFRRGVMVSESWSDPATGKLVIRTSHDGVSATSSDIDTDGDGRLDTRRRYDRRGEIVATEPIAPTAGR